MPWSASTNATGFFGSMPPRRVRKRKPHLVPYWFMDTLVSNSPIEVAPVVAQPSKPTDRGLLGQARFSKALVNGVLDPRLERNMQRFAGTSDWLGEGVVLGSDQRIWAHTTMQSVTGSAAGLLSSNTISAGLVLCNPLSFGINLTLPDAKTWYTDITIKNRSAYTAAITIFGNSVAQRIDGRRSVALALSFGWVTLKPDGSHWWIVSTGTTDTGILSGTNQTVTSDTTVSSYDDAFLLDTTSSTVDVMLPNATDYDGRVIRTVWSAGTNAATVSSAGGLLSGQTGPITFATLYDSYDWQSIDGDWWA